MTETGDGYIVFEKNGKFLVSPDCPCPEIWFEGAVYNLTELKAGECVRVDISYSEVSGIRTITEMMFPAKRLDAVSPVNYGDVNLDGTVSIADSVAIL